MNRSSPIPGIGLTLGFAMAYLGLLALVPLATVFIKAADLDVAGFLQATTSARALAALKLSLGAALTAAAVNAIVGVILAWVLVRYDFWGRRVIDSLVDLPFALPTAVAGIALVATYGQEGPIGQLLYSVGIQSVYSPLGIVIALVFVSLPFSVRTVQPVLSNLDAEVEDAASTLGATRLQTLWYVVLPQLVPAILTGFALTFARALGEYGSVVFISGNLPMRTEIAPLLIMTRLEQFDYAGAAAIAVVMLGISFAVLVFINLLEIRASRRRSRSKAHDVRPRTLDDFGGFSQSKGV